MLTLIVPTIHSNGTAKDTLLADLERANSALGAALDALMTISPNARDYYPQGPGAYNQAMLDHASRLSRLLTVRDEVRFLYETLAE